MQTYVVRSQAHLYSLRHGEPPHTLRGEPHLLLLREFPIVAPSAASGRRRGPGGRREVVHGAPEVVEWRQCGRGEMAGQCGVHRIPARKAQRGGRLDDGPRAAVEREGG